MPSLFGFRGMAIALVVGLAVGGVSGWRITQAFADRDIAAFRAAAIQSRLNAAKADLRIDKDARDEASAAAAAIEDLDRRNQEILHEPRSESPQCDDTVGDAGIRWLQRIR